MGQPELDIKSPFTDLFQEDSSQTVTSIDRRNTKFASEGRTTQDMPEKTESIYEAKDHPKNISFNLFIEQGDRVRIRLEKEKIGENKIQEDINFQSQDAYKYIQELSSKLSKVETGYEIAQGKLKSFSEENVSLTEENYKLKEMLSGMEARKEKTTNPIEKISNFISSIFMVIALCFLAISILDIFITRQEAIFGLFLSIMSGGFFYMDKFYRRSISNG